MSNIDTYVNRVFNALLNNSIVENKWSESVRQIKAEIDSYPVKSVSIKLTDEQSNLINEIEEIKRDTLNLLNIYLVKDDNINFCSQIAIAKTMVNDYKKERNEIYNQIREEKTKWLKLSHKTMIKPKRKISARIRVALRKLLSKN
jgi:hypothetical protein